MENFYKVLELCDNASFSDVKKNYRRLILKYHPDVNNSVCAVEKFKKIVNAYKVLSTPHKNIVSNPLMKDKFSEEKPEIYNSQNKRKSRFLFLKRILLPIRHKRGPQQELKTQHITFKVDKELLTLSKEELSERFLMSENKYVRAEALKALVVGYGRTSYKLVTLGLKDISKEVKEVSIKAVGYLMLRQGIEHLKGLYNKSSRNTKKLILQALSNIPSKNVNSVVLNACFEDDSELRLEGLKAMKKLKLFSEAPKIKSLTYDRNLEIQGIAKEIFEKSKNV